jgi:hypothetical protein
MHGALAYVRERFDAAVPADVLERLRAHPVRTLRRVTHRVAGQSPSISRTLGLGLVFVDSYRASARLHGERPGPLRFVDFVRHNLQIETRAALARRAAGSLLARGRSQTDDEGEVVLPPEEEDRVGASAARSPDTLAL